MSNEKKYYWLKLKDDFFTSKRIKKLRRQAGGDTYLIIYLKMQLKALKTGGVLSFTGVEDNFISELALDLDEEPDNVEMTLLFLQNHGMIETSDNFNYFLPYVIANTGSETAVAERVRQYRERQKSLQCNTDVTLCNTEIEINKDKELDTDNKRNRFAPPTLDEVKAYVKERNSNVDPVKFWEYYETGGWKDSKGNSVKNWKQKLLTWEKKDSTPNRNAPVSNDPKKWQQNAGFKNAITDLING